MSKLILLIALLGALWVSHADYSCQDTDAAFASFSNCQVAVPGVLSLRWKYTNDAVTIAVDAKAAGWVAVGLSDNGGMYGADVWVFRTVNGRDILEDRFSDAFATPKLDAVQNLQLLQSSRVNGRTIFTFTRPVSNCDDQNNDFRIPNVTSHVIYAWSDSDSNAFGYHGDATRGSVNINLLAPAPAPVPPASTFVANGWKSIDAVMSNYTIPGQLTTYACSPFTFPSDVKYHAVAIEPIVHTDLVHHMILFACTAAPTFSGVTMCAMGQGGCNVFWQGWAPGGRVTVLPPHVGLPFGAGNAVSFMLQMHYNNIKGATTVVDNSGFRVWYTPQLRANDMGVLTIGQNAQFLKLAPGMQSVTVSGNCPSVCTNRLPADGINIMGAAMHMHTLGRAMKLSLVRNNVASPLAAKAFYDFNHQGSQPVNTKLLQGDRIDVTCTYNTLSKTDFTLGGESTNEEMCYAFLSYWPATSNDIRLCFDISEMSPSPYVGVGYCPLPGEDARSYKVFGRPLPATTPAPPLCAAPANNPTQPPAGAGGAGGTTSGATAATAAGSVAAAVLVGGLAMLL